MRERWVRSAAWRSRRICCGSRLRHVRQATNRPFNLNFFVHKNPQSHFRGDGAGCGPTLTPISINWSWGRYPSRRSHLRVSIKNGSISSLSFDRESSAFHFGLPESSAVQRLKEAGCIVISSATTVAEARTLEANGADVVIAQGYDAGGHRGTFSGVPGAGMVGTMALVPQIVDAVRVPVIAAGGIVDGRGIAAAFALGASGVQMGTAFLGCPECHRLAALPRPIADCVRRCDRTYVGLHRPAGARDAQSFRRPKWRTPNHWIFRCRRASSARCWRLTERSGASRFRTGLGGTGGPADP